MGLRLSKATLTAKTKSYCRKDSSITKHQCGTDSRKKLMLKVMGILDNTDSTSPAFKPRWLSSDQFRRTAHLFIRLIRLTPPSPFHFEGMSQ